MFSLGMVMCAIFNNGRALIQAGNSASAYLKQLETVSEINFGWMSRTIDANLYYNNNS